MMCDRGWLDVFITLAPTTAAEGSGDRHWVGVTA